MKILYFKTNNLYGDTYVPEGNFCKVVSITKDKIEFWADDENFIEGAYKTLESSKKDFLFLRNAAEKGDRKKGLELIKDLHKTNEKILSNPLVQVKVDPSREVSYPYIKQEFARTFFEQKPILN